ncbi:sigma E protease regulator RseP [Neptunicella marina]|uniref:Zinc metalloprotease n=1 Tax=Neptunicella marina TaxID=2125989 RepID=A0A8J6M2X6_9ALTE|nr:sigma E protease regulator RseP [Neptunicella marina]MBC3764886.1 sigma E protease regulator RseP [Neptunicella marina]
MLAFVQNLFFFVVALGILVAVHEWGHFWVARRCGVKVERFSVGFGKALWKTKDKLGTEYVIAAIPLGGYVKMLDERVEQVREQDLPYAFNRQSVYKRIAIVAAGPLTNFIFAVFALWLMFMLGVDTVKPVIGNVTEDSIASRSVIQLPSQIVKVGEHDTVDWEAVNLEMVSHIGEASLPMTLLNTETKQTYQISLPLSDWQFDPDKQSAFSSLGIQPYFPKVTTVIAMVAEDSAAKRANIQQKDKIIAIDGTPVQEWEQIVSYIAARPGQNVTIELVRDGENISKDVLLGKKNTQNGQEQGYLGVVPQAQPWPESYRFTQQFNPLSAFWQGMLKTWRLVTLSFDMLGKLFTGDVSVKNLSGPISIAQGAGASASYGLVYFLSFLALISVNLGIVNLLPLPVLDGGHLMYYLVEMVRGRPVSEKVQEIGFRIGGTLLFLFMTMAIMNDIARL